MAKKYGRVNMKSQKTKFDYTKCVVCQYKKDAKFIGDDGVCDDCKAAQAKQENFIVTDKSNPEARAFISQSWNVPATSEQDAIDKVASGFWEPLREQCKKELMAYKAGVK